MTSAETRGASRGTFLVYAGLGLLQRGLSLLLIPLVTRAMSLQDYGAVAVLTAGAALISTLVGGSVEQAVFRNSVPGASEEGRAHVLAAHRWLFLILPIIAGVLACILVVVEGSVLHVPTELWAMELVGGALLAPLTYFALPRARAQNSRGGFVLLASASIGLLLGTKVVFVLILAGGARGWAFSDLLTGVGSFLLAAVVSRKAGARSSRADYGGLLRFSAPLLPHVLSFWALASLSRPMMALTLPLEEIAIYAAAYSAAAVGVMVLGELNRAALAGYVSLDLAEPSTSAVRMIRLQIAAAFGCTALVVALAPLYGSLILPPQYNPAIGVTGVLALMPLAYGLYLIPANVVMQTLGATKRAWKASAGGTVALFVFTVPAGLLLGARGIAVVNDLAYAAMAVIALLTLRQLVGRVRSSAWFTRVRPPLPLRVSGLLVVMSAFCGAGTVLAWTLLGAASLLALASSLRGAGALRLPVPR